MPASLPSGTVTFLFTDIEGSTQFWERLPELMDSVLTRHDSLAADLIAQHHGVLVKERGEGDSLFCVFARATDAVAAAFALQHAFTTESWSLETPLKVRMALHTGETIARDGDYYGRTVNRCARLRAIGHGGQTLLSRATQALVYASLPAGCRLQERGSHRLKDLSQPEWVYELLHPDLPVVPERLRSLETFAHNLPIQLTSFIGREWEITEVHRLLASTRLLTLTGPGGCGKTRLALQASAELVDAYPDGVWFVELATVTDPALAPSAVASVLGVREEPGRPLADTLADFLGKKSLLLVLDNCEHLIESCADSAALLLQNCPNVKLLATSREPLGIPGETIWGVPSLLPPDLDNLPPPDTLLHNDATRLFLERAQSAQPAFVIHSGNARAVAQICHRLDGIPLAIELAAARVSVLTPKQIADRLDRLPDLLGRERGRHKTLRACFEWSHRLLTGAEQTVFRRLAVFVGGWTLEAAEAVCSGEGIAEEDVLSLLSRLVRASLVRADDAGEEKRYRLLETMRQFGAEKWAQAGEQEATREHHFRYFLELAEEAEPYLTGGAAATWLATLEAEHDNLRAALKWAETDATPEVGLQLASALHRFWNTHGHLSEGRSCLETALRQSADVKEAIRAKACNAAGILAASQADYTAALAFYESSLSLQRQLGDSEGIAATLNNLGTVWRQLDDSAKAESYFEQSLAIYRERNDTVNIANASNNLALIAYDRGDYAAARPLFEECLAKLRLLVKPWNIAWALHNLAETLYYLGDDPLPLFEESLLIKQTLEDRRGVAFTLFSLAKIAKAHGDYRRAVILLGTGANLLELMGVPLQPSDQADQEDIVATAHGKLSAKAFTEAWEYGGSLSLEQTVKYALQREAY